MIAKDVLKQVLASNQKDVERYGMVSKALPADDFFAKQYAPGTY